MTWQARVDGALLRTAARLADPVRRALQNSFDPEKVIRDFQRDYPYGSSITPAQARDWARVHVPIKSGELSEVFRQLYATGYVFGEDLARSAIAYRRLNKAPDPEVELTVDWDKWKPGDAPASALLKPKGALRRLLDRNRPKTIKGISDTTLDRIGRILSDGLLVGATNQTLADELIEAGIRGISKDPVRALTIATTETARAVSVATMETYKEFDVAQVEWLALEGCDDCEANAEQGPIPLGDTFDSGDSEPPAHPNCRCTVLPVLPND